MMKTRSLFSMTSRQSTIFTPSRISPEEKSQLYNIPPFPFPLPFLFLSLVSHSPSLCPLPLSSPLFTFLSHFRYPPPSLVGGVAQW